MKPFKTVTISHKKHSFYKLPELCPVCGKNISPVLVYQKFLEEGQAYCFFQCPSLNCKVCFSALYSFSSEKVPKGHYFDRVVKPIPKVKEFSDEINETSPSFVKIYNEAYTAEQTDLHEIAGMAYRKALEFLIKDFLIKGCPEEEEKIKKMFLGRCIKDCVDNPKIKETAKRAVWLGNDHSHYYKKWINHDINNLKALVQLTVNWIQNEILYRKLKDDMPE